MNQTLAYLGSFLLIIWSIIHLVPTRAVLREFGPLDSDNSRQVIMGWLVEGLTLMFVGVMVLLLLIFKEPDNGATFMVIRIVSAYLLILAFVSYLVGNRTNLLPLKASPLMKCAVAAMYLSAAL
ncbi:MAG: hypothetical protein KA754_04955 [Corallincola sp.]|nr:hypothetical protein [Corallincola sp.]